MVSEEVKPCERRPFSFEKTAKKLDLDPDGPRLLRAGALVGAAS